MSRVIILEEAAEDIEQARTFYDSVETGLGDYCVDSFLADLDRLELLHGIHPVHFGFYRMLSERFPFGIYYQETSSVTQVFAVLDLRRDPTWIRAELARRND